MRGRAFLAICVIWALPAWADPPVIEDATLNGTTLHVTLSHPDTGWDHYADGWSVETPDGTALGLRVLSHPHVTEQPFTRSLSLDLPDGVSALHIRARCGRDGWGKQVFVLPLP